MYEYKSATFFTEYFLLLDDFVLVEEFHEDKVCGITMYVAIIIPIDCPHKVEIRVEIPKTFPHNKLMFTTRDMSGYPHLIPYGIQRKGENWFCLNTPFAETAERQLDEEIQRLRTWIHVQTRADLPPHIKDKRIVSGLQMASLYSGQNADELEETRDEGEFFFIGNYAEDAATFPEKGKLNVVAYSNDIYTVVEHEHISSKKVPYVLVDHFPSDLNSVSAFVNEFGWDEELVNFLLPALHYGYMTCESKWNTEESAHTALRDIVSDTAKQTIPDRQRKFIEDKVRKCIDVFDQLRKRREELGEENERVKKLFSNEKYSPMSMFGPEHVLQMLNDDKAYKQWFGSIGDDDDDWEEDPSEIYNYEQSHREYFAVGVKEDDQIVWLRLCSNLHNTQSEKFYYSVGENLFSISVRNEIRLFSPEMASRINNNSYFGRGRLSRPLTKMHIGLIGVGAIGAALAETLARGGLNEISIWDNDIVEAGNICRSAYSLNDIGDSKAHALRRHLQRVNPYIKVTPKGGWYRHNGYDSKLVFTSGDFYGNINYDSQQTFIEELKEYDLLIDCTASNELLHFLSYAATNVPVISLCITNKSQDMLCVSNKDSNMFEMRKHMLANIEQEDGNFYTEGTGCYQPTFLATYCDIQALVNIAIRTINKDIATQGGISSRLWHYSDDNILCEKLCHYVIEGGSIRLTMSEKVMGKIGRIPASKHGDVAYLVGGYSKDRSAIYVTDAVPVLEDDNGVERVQKMSEGILDYVGSVMLSSNDLGILKQQHDILVDIASRGDIDTCNPLCALLSADNTLSFYLLINSELIPFCEE